MFKKTCIRAGQARAYQDSVYEYAIESDLPIEEVRTKCLTEVYKCNPENTQPDLRHTGACGFPFGLDNFYTFKQTGEGKYSYTVTSPYCG